MKTCAKCGETKPLFEFHAKPNSQDGMRASCKICWNAANKDWKKLNTDHVKSYQAKYRLENAQKKKASQISWREKNREKENAQRRENPEKYRIHTHNRRALLKSLGKLTPGISIKLFELQKGKCACCKKPLGTDYHMDHIIPLALGGTNTDENIQLLRAKCNKQKGAKHPIDFMQQRGFLL